MATSLEEPSGFQKCTPRHAAAAQKLIADGVAQRRNRIARYLLLHPLVMTAYLGLVILVFYANWRTIVVKREIGSGVLMTVGVTMAVLVFVERITAVFLDQARHVIEDEDLMHIKDPSKGSSYVYIHRGHVIATITASIHRQGKAQARIQGLTVAVKYRHHRIGSDLFDILLETLPADCAVEVAMVSVEWEMRCILEKRGFQLVKTTHLNGLVGMFVSDELWRIEELTRWAESRNEKQQYFDAFTNKKDD